MTPTEKRLSPADALIIHTVRPNLLTFDKLWPGTLSAFDADRFEKQVKMAVSKVPELALCTPQSILESLLSAAELGLDPSGALGSAHLVPFRDICQLIIGYRGMIDLASRAGVVRAVEAFVVREKDEFSYSAGSMPKHRPYIPRPAEDQDPGKVWCAWAMAVMPSAKKSVVMSLRELEAVRARARAKRGPWSGSEYDVAEMYKKTCLRRLLKTVPMSPVKAGGLAKALEMEEAQERDEEKEINEAPPPKAGKGANGIEAKLGIANPPEDAEVSPA